MHSWLIMFCIPEDDVMCCWRTGQTLVLGVEQQEACLRIFISIENSGIHRGPDRHLIFSLLKESEFEFDVKFTDDPAFTNILHVSSYASACNFLVLLACKRRVASFSRKKSQHSGAAYTFPKKCWRNLIVRRNCVPRPAKSNNSLRTWAGGVIILREASNWM